MIKFEKTEVVGWEAAIRGMRNPMNSWDKSDSGLKGPDKVPCSNCACLRCDDAHFEIGLNDLALMKKLVKAGADHRKFMRMIVVYVDITAPLYWWKEFDTYKVGTVANSCSTMHKITEKEFTIDDFSHEHLIGGFTSELDEVLGMLNYARDKFIETKDKKYWWQMIQLLPSSYNQKRTVMMSYEVLANIYKPTSRRHHKLDEWNVDFEGSFCDWIRTLPYSELITGEDDKDEKTEAIPNKPQKQTVKFPRDSYIQDNALWLKLHPDYEFSCVSEGCVGLDDDTIMVLYKLKEKK